MKFKSDIEVQAGLKDSSGAAGTSGQVLSSLGTSVAWTAIDTSTANDVENLVKAGVAINKGQAVYVTGADGTNIIVGLASNAAEATSSKTLGLLDATVAINGMANVVQIGRLEGLNTIGANAGDPVWLGTNGNLIYGLANKPYAPAHLVYIGVVTRVNANNGEIFINVQNGFELDELHNVSARTPSNNNGIFYNTSTSLWEAKSISAAGGIEGSGTTNYVPKFTGASAIGNSAITDNGSLVEVSSREFRISAGTTSSFAAGITSHSSFAFGSTNGRRVSIIADNTGQSNGLQFGYDDVDNTGIIAASTQGAATGLDFYTYNGSAWGNRMRISSAGNLLIGTTTDAGYKLDVNGTVRANGVSASPVLYLTNASGGTTSTFTITENTGLIINSYESTSARSIDLRVGGTSALTIASSQAATFSSAVTNTSGMLLNVGATGTNANLNYTTFTNGVYSALNSATPTEGVGMWSDNQGNGMIGSLYNNNASSLNLVVKASSSTNGFVALKLQGTGVATFSSLAGSGTRFVVADTSGTLSSTTGGPISGSGSSGQVTFWNGANSITGESNLFWDSTNDRLGIGTSSPTTKLEVIGGTSNVNGYSDGSIQVTGLNPIAFVGPSNLNPSLNRWGFKLREVTDGDFSIYNYRESSTALMIKNSGNVLIGTTTDAGYKLDVNGTGRFKGTAANGSAFFNFETTSANGTFNWVSTAFASNLAAGNNLIHFIGQAGSSKNSAYLGFKYAGSGSNDNILTLGLFAVDNVLNINGAGNVGIGTTSPYAKFSVNNGTNINLGIKVGQTDSSAVMLNAYNDAVTANIPLEFRASKFNFENGNVGIGTATPSYKTTIAGNPRNTDVLCVASDQINSDSAQSFVGISLQDQYANGGGNASAIRSYSNLYSQWGTTLTFSTTANSGNGVVERMRITAGGNVGIGTESPSQKFDVNGVGAFGKQDYSIQGVQRVLILRGEPVSGVYANSSYRFYTTPGALSSAQRLSITAEYNGTESVDLFSLTGTGNVLIGTTTDAGYKLDVNGSGRFSENLNVNSGLQFRYNGAFRGQIIDYNSYGGGSDYSPFFTSESTLAFGVNGTSTKILNLAIDGKARFNSTVTATGFYTPGFTIPTTAKAVINNTNYGGPAWNNASLVTGNGATGVIFGGDAASYTYGWIQGVQTDNGAGKNLVLQPIGGDVLIGKTAGGYNTAGIQTEGTGTRIGITRGTSGECLYLNKINSETGNTLVFYYNGGSVGTVSITSSATSYNTSSDYRLKQDLKPINGLDLVSQIKVYDYQWKSDETRAYGVLAHELQEVIPQAVNGEKDGENMQGVDYSKLVPILVQAIQDQQKQIEKLKTLINK